MSRDEIEQANAMAKQLHVYKPGINFVPGALLEVLDVRDNNWYECKVIPLNNIYALLNSIHHLFFNIFNSFLSNFLYLL